MSGCSSIFKIASVSGNALTLKASTTFQYEIKTNVFKLEYNQVKFYSGTTLIDTVAIKSDYFTSLSHTVVANVNYSISFYNSTSSEESIKGKTATIYDRMLCSIADILQYEEVTVFAHNKFRIMDKIDIATQETLNSFIIQEQDIEDLVDRDLLRSPAALLALHYIFFSLIKKEDDAASLKAEQYKSKYDAKIIEISEVINKTEDNVQLFGQTRCLR